MTAVPAPVRTGVSTQDMHLRRHFRRSDFAFCAVAAVVGLDTIGAVAADGAQAFTWMVFLGVFFLLPYALLTAELGSTFPAEGGPYVWVRMAFGRLAGAVASVFYWISNPIWLGGTLCITSVAVIGEFFTPIHGAAEYVFGLAFVWITVTAVMVSTRWGRWLPNLGGILRIVLLGFFTLTVLIYAAEHGVHGFGGGEFKPSYAVFIAAVPVLAFNYVGVEVPAAAGGEIEDPQRAVPFYVLRSSVTVFFLYVIPILAILLVLPVRQVTSLGSFIDAFKTVFTVYGGHVSADGTATLTGAGRALGDVAAIAFVVALMAAAAAWLMGADRALAVSAAQGSAPPILARFSRRWGTPAAVNIMSGTVSTISLVLALTLTHGSAAKYFSAVLGVVISTTLLSYAAICPAVIKLRYSHAGVQRPYRLPFGNTGAWVCGLLGGLWAVFGTLVLVWPGLGTGHPDASLPEGFAGQRAQYELTQLLPMAAIVLLGLVFYALGRTTRSAPVRD